jgi:SNF2 family DNA or RNA helicase
MAFESDRPRSTRFRELYLKKCAGAQSRSVGNPWMFDVLLTTPEIVCSDDFTELTTIKWECLVVDEAQKIKNIKSKLSINLRDARFKVNQRVLCTGTPIQNSMEELFSLLNFVDPDLFKDCDEFLEKYGEMKSKEVLDVLHEEIGPFILRRLKEDVEKSVPPKEETVIEVELTVAQKQYYRALFEKNVKFLHKNKKKAMHGPSLNNLAMQLRKCCNHLFLLHGIEEEYCHKEQSKNKNIQEVDLLVSGSGKLVLLDKLLPRLKQDGHRILIFSQFALMLNLLEDYLVLRDWSFERIDGSITGDKRQQAIDRFQAQDTEGKDPPFIMLLTTKAGGVGINLTGESLFLCLHLTT